MGFVSRLAIANQWLFRGMLLNKMAQVPQSNALTRTTTAITMLKGSNGVNVLPQVVEIVVNFRILPGESSQDVLNHIKKQCEGFDVEIDAPRIPVEPSAISPAEGKPFEMIRKGVAQLYPGTIVSPYITIGATDSKHMGDLSDRIYRFAPVLLHPAEQRSIHNFNEYITIENYGRMIAFYTYMISQYDKAN
jgi:carboxypeptidase PM20D1